MKIAGIIAEYNPFHSGHAYHIQKTREITGCDYVAVCMSGNFVQRGEAACMDKWQRAEMALKCGADAVFELPALFALRTADAFARGGVKVLDGIGCDVLCFGSETADIEYLMKAAEIRENEPENISEMVKKGLSEGKSHARALGEATAEYLGLPADALNAPNTTLGVEYIRAIGKLDSKMQPVAVERLGSYHAESMGEGGFASASAIRKALLSGDIDAAKAGVPENVRNYISEARMHAPDDILLHILRGMTPEMIAMLPDVNEGLENRVYKIIGKSDLGTLPFGIVLLAIVFVLSVILFNHTRMGRNWYLVGTSQEVARFTGIDPRREVLLAHMYSSLMCFFGAMILGSRMASGRADIADGYGLQAITAAVFGGVSIKGGSGTLGGALLGVLIFTLLKSGFNMVDINQFYVQVATGVLLIIVLILRNLRTIFPSLGRKN